MSEINKDRVVSSSAVGSKPSIGIIGAGVSGLRCATVLLSAGYRVTLIEGRDRIGGRVHQITLPGTDRLVDVGANWIHGAGNNPILALAAETGSLTYPLGDESVGFFDDRGERFQGEEAALLEGIIWEIIGDGFEYSREKSATIAANVSLRDWIVEKLDEKIAEGVLSDRQKVVVLQIASIWGGYVGSSFETQSLKYFWLEEGISKGDVFCASTYEKILARIARTPLTHSLCEIKLSTRAVRATSEQGDLQSNGSNAKVVVTTDGGEDLPFDDVVVTTPLGWLKQNLHAFAPELPSQFTDAVKSLGYGCLEKVYITFPSAFWQTATNEPLLPGFTIWLAPTYNASNPNRWPVQGANLASLPDATSHPTLLFYIFGAQSQHLSNALRDLSSSAASAWLLNYFAPYLRLLPGYTASAPACQPISAFFTNWLADDLAGNGSYSNFQTVASGQQQQQHLDKDIETIRHGLPDRGVWFGGEHTAPFLDLGTVHGAYRSGDAIANRIIAARGGGEEKGEKEAHVAA